MDLKTLEKLTVIKLREEALKIPDLGIRAMGKEDLVRVIAVHYKIDLAGRRRGGAGKSDLKKQIRELRAKIQAALRAKNADETKKLRGQAKRLKRQTRHLAATKAATPEGAAAGSAA